jgi:hypothetical protein
MKTSDVPALFIKKGPQELRNGENEKAVDKKNRVPVLTKRA